jgi:hypothetical protein
LPCPLQAPTRAPTTGDLLPLSPLGTRLTAGEPELLLAALDPFVTGGAAPRPAAHRCRRGPEAIGRSVLVAVSDHRPWKPPAPRQRACARPSRGVGAPSTWPAAVASHSHGTLLAGLQPRPPSWPTCDPRAGRCGGATRAVPESSLLRRGWMGTPYSLIPSA